MAVARSEELARMTPIVREFFPRVRKTVVPRPIVKLPTHVPGQSGSVRAAAATIFGPNWYHDPYQDLIEIWDAGPALCFKDVLPQKDFYAKEGLYLRLQLAYRTTANAYVNIRTFSGNHVTLPNSQNGSMYEDPFTRFWVTDDCTININSIYRNERIWLQRIDWEWVSQETIFFDELVNGDPYLSRTREQVDACYAPKAVDTDSVKEMLVERLRNDDRFARRCLLLLREDAFLEKDLVALHQLLSPASE